MLEFDTRRLVNALLPERDLKFAFLGLQTLYDRYFIQHDGRRIELPQIFWMRVAMGLCLNEGAQKNDRAIEFYELLSSFHYTSATPTLFNSGTLHPQLSSCYLSTVQDDLDQIFKSYRDNALLSKWAGGLGNDWTNVRALGAKIKGTGGKSQGVVPILKIANDGAVAVNHGGKRKGANCAYLESWHLDIEEFLELRKNTGDDRRRTHDMNTANWIPDLFMKRVQQNGQWTLFSPNDVPDLHHLFGQKFEEAYTEYERKCDTGELKLYKRIAAVDLWRKMLSMLFETGHPWITFKDPSNVRSPQDHVGVVHNSNLCTEILLNNSGDETAVCNLGSINLAAHITVEHETDLFGQDTGTHIARLNVERIKQTVNTAIRMLDNVIDLNFYPTIEARNANMRHRPVGLGIMGFQDALYLMGHSYASEEAIQFADYSMEVISYYAIQASTELARERGAYPTYEGSKWHKGYLPIDTIELLEQERGERVDLDRTARLDWAPVRHSLKTYGMRNSNVMAIAPTATISNIVGVSQSIEPTYKNLYVKSNLSGEFTQVNVHLVNDLKALGLWDADMLEEIKYSDGDLADIDRIPPTIRDRYKTSFEVEPHWIIECAARRQKWIDMGESLNLYMNQPSGRKLNDMYFLAWRKGLKTTYYLRGLAATQVEKSTVDINKFGIQPKWMKSKSASAGVGLHREATTEHTTGIPQAASTTSGGGNAGGISIGAANATPPGGFSVHSDEALTGGIEPPKACSIDNPDCEACQ
jgi:ribonucleoside-diphosphate reductase alpha chain